MIDRVKIGDIDFAIVLGVKAGEERPQANTSNPNDVVLGEISYPTARIYIDETQDRQVMRCTLWHEIVHGILLQAGQFEAGENEALVTALGYGIAQVVRNNPKLIDYTWEEI